jgi:DNA helicase-2/ATP-dependent DNA helicase PcrA
MIDLTGLNEQQKQAVLHTQGPCLVLATAGSGKTRVLTLRAARLIDEGIPASRILLATFTKKAAEEMRGRLAGMIGEERAKPAWVGTFHSHCLRILKVSYHELHMEPFEVLAPGQAIRLARDILAPADAKHPYGMDWQMDPKLPLSYISRAKADLYDVERAERFFREKTDMDDSIPQFVDFWIRYEKAKAEAKQLDFDDFLLKTYQLLSTNEQVLGRWRPVWDYILEDEVQDTMVAQHEIVTMLAANHRNYFAVGDVNQSVYGFRGANPDHTVQSFHKDFPEGLIIKLGINYRSQSSIVDTGSRLIRHNAVPAAYTLEPISSRAAEVEPQLFVANNEDDEAEIIAKGIVENLLDGRAYRDIALLYRVNAQSRALEDAMIMHQIPYVVFGSCGFYGRKEIQDALAYLQLAHDPKCDAGDEAIKRVANIASIWFRLGPERKYTHYLGKAFFEKLGTVARQNRCALWEALDLGYFENYQQAAIEDFQEIVRSIRAAGVEPGDMIRKAREVGYDAHLAREEGSGDEENEGTRFENLDELITAASRFDNVGAFLDFITSQQSKAKKVAKDQDVVQLLTMHRSKGLEWPVVWLCGVSQGLLPHARSVNWYDPETKRHIIPESIEEERRLCYVGVTRARDELHISALLEYSMRELAPSPFLTEMGYEVPAEFAKQAPVVNQAFEDF